MDGRQHGPSSNACHRNGYSSAVRHAMSRLFVACEFYAAVRWHYDGRRAGEGRRGAGGGHIQGTMGYGERYFITGLPSGTGPCIPNDQLGRLAETTKGGGESTKMGTSSAQPSPLVRHVALHSSSRGRWALPLGMNLDGPPWAALVGTCC